MSLLRCTTHQSAVARGNVANLRTQTLVICYPQTPLFSIQSVRAVTCCLCLDLFLKIPWCHLPHPKVLYDLGSLKCTQTIQLKILHIKLKLLNLTLWKSNPLQSVSNSAGETKKRGEMASPQFTFLSFSNGMACTNHLIFEPEFQVFPSKWQVTQGHIVQSWVKIKPG